MYQIFPTSLTPANRFRAYKVVNTETGEDIASFPFSLEKVSGEAACAALMLIDRLNGSPRDPFVTSVFDGTNAIV